MSETSKGWPTVSVVVPVRDEAAHLERTVASVLAQDYPLPFDVCLAVGPSRDGTEDVAAAIAARDRRVRVVPNSSGRTPAALNTAIAATDGEVVVRVDAHAELPAGYIRRAVETMRTTGAVNVGGVQLAVGETDLERAVAAAMSSWFGTGGSRFHVGGDAGPVDTVYLGVFDRRAGDAAGWFDESLTRNQDYELNIRLRDGGGVVWFDPGLAVRYRPRSSLSGLARQYFQYGRWKAEVLARRPDSVRVRQIVPAATPLVLLASLVAAPRRPLALVVPAGYLAAVGGVSAAIARRAGVRTADLVRVFPTLQMSWGAGFARGAAAAVADRVGRLRARAADRPG